MISLPKESKKSMSLDLLIGLQVIDTKGSAVGSVKDVSVNFEDKELSFRVATKGDEELDFSWDDVQSVHDVVLLKKPVDLSAPATETTEASPKPPAVQALLICPSCGTASPGHAKFCPKCGTSLK